MIEIKIESGIPFSTARGTGLCAALRRMKVGDSFVYPKRKRGSFGSYQGRLGMKFKSATISDTEVRIWRIA